jgi:hypothetical protein
MPWGLQEFKSALAELDCVTVFNRSVRKGCAGFGTKIDSCAGALSKLVVAGNEVGVQMRFNNVLDPPAALASRVEIDFNVTLGINDGGDALGADKIRGMRQTSQKEMLDFDRGHG